MAKLNSLGLPLREGAPLPFSILNFLHFHVQHTWATDSSEDQRAPTYRQLEPQD